MTLKFLSPSQISFPSSTVVYTTTLSLVCLQTQLIFLLSHAPPLFSISVMAPPNPVIFYSSLSSSLSHPIIHQALPILPAKYLSLVCQFHFISTAMSSSQSQRQSITSS